VPRGTPSGSRSGPGGLRQDHGVAERRRPRPARSRIAVGLGNTVQVLITMDFWEDDVARVLPTWDNVLKALVLGQHIRDPRDGAAIDPELQ